MPLLLDTEYTVIFDDDTIPQPGWIEHAIGSSKQYNAIVGAVGMIVGSDAQYFMIAPIEYPLEVGGRGEIESESTMERLMTGLTSFILSVT